MKRDQPEDIEKALSTLLLTRTSSQILQPIFISYRSRICNMGTHYNVKINLKPQINTCGLFVFISDIPGVQKAHESPPTSTQLRLSKDTLSLLVSTLLYPRMETIGVVECSARSSGSGASWTGFESQFWHLSVDQPRASHPTLWSLLCSFLKQRPRNLPG